MIHFLRAWLFFLAKPPKSCPLLAKESSPELCHNPSRYRFPLPVAICRCHFCASWTAHGPADGIRNLLAVRAPHNALPSISPSIQPKRYLPLPPEVATPSTSTLPGILRSITLLHEVSSLLPRSTRTGPPSSFSNPGRRILRNPPHPHQPGLAFMGFAIRPQIQSSTNRSRGNIG